MTNPRPRSEVISSYYPDNYPAHVGGGEVSAKSRLRYRLMAAQGVYPDVNSNPLVKLLFSVLGMVLGGHINPIIPHVKGGRLIDIGCARGDFLSWAKSVGWNTYGVEIDEKAVAIARRRGLEVFLGTLEEAEYPTSYFDIITLIQVLEHCFSPGETIRKCETILLCKVLLLKSSVNSIFLCERKWMDDRQRAPVN